MPRVEITERERQVLEYLAEGLRNKEIAGKLGISEETVKFHVRGLLSKPGVRDRTHAVTTAVRRGILHSAGSCKQNILIGEQVDLTRIPAPLLHDGDGGRYLNTFGIIVAQTPDKKWMNWSIARIMLLDRNRMAGIIAPNQHIGMVRKTWTDAGKDMPFALALGAEPFLGYVGGMPLPAFVDEAGFVGGYFGEPVDVVQCETVDLRVPATSEIVVEGYLSRSKTDLEGPTGEYAGYLRSGPGTQKPVYHATAMTDRNDPILPISVAGEPVEENHTAGDFRTRPKSLDTAACGLSSCHGMDAI